MTQNIPHNIKRRRMIQWCLLPAVMIVLGFGWKYPILGFIVPIVMILGVILSFSNGRFACGNICPRGAFYDRLISKISPNKPIPSFFRNIYFRWIVFIALIGLMMFRILQNPTSLNHWGMVFWSLCLITTVLGIVLAIFIHQRTWCAFCPIGTLANAIGGNKNQLMIQQDQCVSCRKCEKVCPANLSLLNDKDKGQFCSKDCLKCSECVAVCPKNALKWPKEKK